MNKKITIGYSQSGVPIKQKPPVISTTPLSNESTCSWIKLPKKYNFAVLIGRMEPFTEAHRENLLHAKTIADHVIVALGSHNQPIDWKNPWTSKERIEMIKASLTAEELEGVHFQAVEDRRYQDKEWQALMYEAVDAIVMDYSKYRVNGRDADHTANICVVGYEKDKSSFYLNMFPTWPLESTLPYTKEGTLVNATDIRKMIYEGDLNFKKFLPEGTANYIEAWMKTEKYQYVKDWYEFDLDYQKPYEELQDKILKEHKYKVTTTFYCADNVIIQSGHILLIKRAKHPGKGLWALPGGHINDDENSFTASLRELKEETGLKIPEKVIIGSYAGEKTFDHPERSLRGRCGRKVGRTVSQSHCYALDDSRGLPRVKGMDDASEAWWFNLAEVRRMRDQLFEDHADQINYWVAKVEDKKRI